MSNLSATTRIPLAVIGARYNIINVRYIIPSICAFGIIANTICCIIFLLPKFKLKIYRLLFWESFFQGAGLLVQVFTPVNVSPLGHLYSSAVYRLAFRTWVYNSCCMCSLLCNLAVSFDRYILVSKKCNCFCSRVPLLVLVPCFMLFSLSCFFFPLFAYYIDQQPDYPEGYFDLYYTDWGYSIGFVEVRIAMFGLRDIVLWIVYVVVNALLLYETRKMFKRKASMTNPKAHHTTHKVSLAPPSSQTGGRSSVDMSKAVAKSASEKAERRMTLMVITMSVVLAVGQVPYFITIILYAVLHGKENKFLSAVTLIINQLAFNTLYFSFCCPIFLFYFFDKNFKSTIDELFKRAFRGLCGSR